MPPIEENQALLQRSKDENKCVDAFAKRGVRQDQDFVVFDNPPFDVLFFMYFDNLSMQYDKHSGQDLAIFILNK